MKDIKADIAIDVTESGSIVYYASLLDGESKYISTGAWKEWGWQNKFTVNALQISTFKEIEVPIVEVKCVRKPGVGRLRAWWWRGWDNSKVYDIEVKEVGKKKITMLKLSSGDVHYVNEPAEVFRNAIDRFANA